MKKLPVETEKEIKEIALNYAKQGRPDWDILHVPAVVHYMKEIISEESGNERVLIPAAWLHDIGYAGLLEEGYSNEDNQKVKEEHMRVGAEMARDALENLDNFTDKEIDEICRLVRIHDDREKIQDKNAQLLFEADSLAQIDVERVPPTFKEKEYNDWLQNHFKVKRANNFETNTGKEYLDEIMGKAENYYD